MKFVVNGEPIDVPCAPDAPLRHGVQHALEQSNNTGRPIADWELRDETGRLLSLDDCLSQLWGLKDADFLFVTLRVGAGG